MTNEVTEEMRQTLLNITSRLLPGSTGVTVRFARCDIERMEELCRRAAEPRAPRGFLGSTPDGGIDDADRVPEGAIPLMPNDVANKITDLVLSEGIAYVLYKVDELPVVLARRDVENR